MQIVQVRRILHNGHAVAVRLIPVGIQGLCEAASRKNQCNSAVASMETLNGVLKPATMITDCQSTGLTPAFLPSALLSGLCLQGRQALMAPHFPILHAQF